MSAIPITKIEDTNGVSHDINDSRVQVATASVAGLVKPDGTTTTIDNDGTLHAAGSPFSTDSSGYINYTY